MAPTRHDDDPLREYHAKRDFAHTPEPAGVHAATGSPVEEHGAPGGLRFVVQRHRARRLHYDFRLELDGVLVSWSVPKGPSLDPAEKRLAVRVEDHPLEYAGFEGVIPAGDYGGGDVIVWDRGTWAPTSDDPARALADGELHLDLFGEKLRGRFALVRRGKGGRADGVRADWLLVHKRDDHAVSGWRVEDNDRSVLSGLTNEQVARAPAARWHSDAEAAEAEEVRSTLPASERAPLPAVTADELAALDALGARGEWEVQGRRIRLSALDTVVVAAGADRPAVTRREVLRYLAIAGPRLVPFLRGRPLARRRVTRAGTSWSETVPAKAPEWVRTWTGRTAEDGPNRRHLVVDDIPTLVWLAAEGTVELHPGTARVDAPADPTWVVLDLEPEGGRSWDDVIIVARLYRTALDHLQVAAAPSVSGRRSIHVFVPVDRGLSFAEVEEWAAPLARAVGAVVPDLVGGRRVATAAPRTVVAPWSPRIAPGAPVAVPIGWDELDDPDLRPDRWTLDEAVSRLDRPDPLARLLGLPQRLPALDGLPD
jgi:bifunctional non-homologous end joining protein LigD